MPYTRPSAQFLARVRQLQGEEKLSLRGFAARLGISPSALSNLYVHLDGLDNDDRAEFGLFFLISVVQAYPRKLLKPAIRILTHEPVSLMRQSRGQKAA